MLELGGDITGLDGLLVPRIREPTLDLDVIRADTEKAVRSPTRHPGRNSRLCIEASYLIRIEGMPAAEASAYLHLKDTGQWMGHPPGGSAVFYYRSVQRVVRTGDNVWAELGAWPWAVYAAGRLPSGWRDDPRVAGELASWYQRARRHGHERILRESRRLRRGRAFQAATIAGPAARSRELTT